MKTNTLQLGDVAPDFEVRSLSGERIHPAQLRGRCVVLIFVRPDCIYSQELFRAIAGVRTDLPPDTPIPVVISYGRKAENESLVREYGIRCPWLLQDDTEVAARYGFRGTPASYEIDEHGRVAGSPRIGVEGVMTHLGVTPAPTPLRADLGQATSAYVPINHRLHALLARFRKEDPFDRAFKDIGAVEEVGRERNPLVTVIMTTRDRPGFLPIALECYRQQMYERRELLVIDDGTRWPAGPEAVSAVGGRIIRVEEGMTLGGKLNRGCEEARGELCLKWDDDDYYAPHFLETLVHAYRRRIAIAGGSAIAYLTLPLLFDLPRWRVLAWQDTDPCGATLLFERQAWEQLPFGDIKTWDDFWFLVGQLEMGAAPVSVPCGDLYAILRHDTLNVGHGHSWNEWAGGEPMNAFLQRWSKSTRDPATVFPAWALSRYESMLAHRVADTSAVST